MVIKMDGLLIINKPKGLTSHDVVNKVRRYLGTKKVGHTGTLDPLATGVLVVCVNNATKLVNFLESDTKKYLCTMCLGISTDTYDITGNIIKEDYNFEISNEQINNVLLSFIGKSKQIPPIYSAIKKDGKKLYEYAREGKELELVERDIEIFDIYARKGLYKKEGKLSFDFFVHVSKGTYIRSLVHDIGLKLGINACMNDLVRLQSGNFKIEDSFTLEEVEVGKYSLVKMIDSIDFLKVKVDKNDDIYKKVINGMKLSCKIFNEKKDKIAFTLNDELIAIYEYNEDEFPCYKALRIWN